MNTFVKIPSWFNETWWAICFVVVITELAIHMDEIIFSYKYRDPPYQQVTDFVSLVEDDNLLNDAFDDSLSLWFLLLWRGSVFMSLISKSLSSTNTSKNSMMLPYLFLYILMKVDEQLSYYLVREHTGRYISFADDREWHNKEENVSISSIIQPQDLLQYRV